MNFGYFNNLLENITAEERTHLTEFIQTVEEIQKNTNSEADSYSHLILREKYFVLVQSIIETNHEFLVKFVFNILKEFCESESFCKACTSKERSQFILNILRFVEHTHVDNDMTKLEIFKFLLNTHEIIGPLLNTKLLQSLTQIAVNEFNSSNKFVQSSSRALMIKYTAVICNQIISLNEQTDELEIRDFDTYLVNYFEFLLSIFNDDNHVYELRTLALECIELLLNNLLSVSKTGTYNLIDNEAFIQFAWQTFCPSILCQFGELSICSKNNTVPHKMPFKLIYTILLQLTGLIGNSESMLTVFEAIYQRILFYPFDQDRNLLLKLFKSYVDKDFILKLTQSKISMVDQKKFNDFTLINLIVGFYRSCYEKAIKTPEDKILKFLSCECICSYVELINALYESFVSYESSKSGSSLKSPTYKLTRQKSVSTCSNDSVTQKMAEVESRKFWEKLMSWLSDLEDEKKLCDSELDLDLEIKKLCVNFIEFDSDNSLENATPIINANIYYATIYFTLNELLKTDTYFKDKEENSSYFKSRINAYDTHLYNKNTNLHYLNEWLEHVYNLIEEYKTSLTESFINSVNNIKLVRQLKFISKQMDCDFLCKVHADSTKLICIQSANNSVDAHDIELIKSLLQCSWTYLVDVLTGFLLHTKIDYLEEILFFKLNPTDQFSLDNDVITDISFKLVAFKSCLESLYSIIKILSKLKSMDKELSQLLLIMNGDYFADASNFSEDNSTKISLNQLICFDFLLHASVKIVCNINVENENNSNRFPVNNHMILWKNLIEIYFAVTNLQGNIDQNTEGDIIQKKTNKPVHKQSGLIVRNSHLFRSVYFNKEDLFFFGKDETENFKSDSRLMGTTTGRKNFIHSSSFDTDANLAKFAKLKYQQEIIIKTLFLFTNSDDKLVSNCKKDLENDYSAYFLSLTKRELIDAVAMSIDQYLNVALFDQIDSYLIEPKENDDYLLVSFEYIWSYLFQICQFSKRFLFQNSSKHEYFTLNNLIIDKLDDALSKLFEKFSYSLTRKDEYNKVSVSLLLPSLSDDQKPYSLYSIFITELWFNVIIDYLLTVLKKSNIFKSTKKRSKKVNEKVPKLIDYSLCKKLISLVQKCLETYLNKSAISHNLCKLTSNDLIKNFDNFKKEVSHPSFPDSISSDVINDEYIQPNSILNQYTKEFLSSILERSSRAESSHKISSQIFMESITSMILPDMSNNTELSYLIRIDELCNFNTVFLMPFIYLMDSERLDSHLQDTVLISLRVLIECNSFQMKSSWNCLFACLNKVNLSSKNYEKLKKLNRADDSSFFSLDLDMNKQEPDTYYSDSSQSDPSSSESSSDSSTSSYSNQTFNSFKPSLRFDSYRLRLISLIEIFNTYLKLAYNSVHILENGSFEFIKCLTYYLQYSYHIEVYKPSEYILDKNERNHFCVSDSDCESSEVSYMSAYECNLEEFHFQITSNFEHLYELSISKNSASSIRPFLDCLETLFNTLITRVMLKPFDDKNSNLQQNCLLREPMFLVNFSIKDIHAYPNLILFEEYFEQENYEKFDSIKDNLITIEDPNDFQELNNSLKTYLKENDTSNTFKLLTYLIENLASRVCLGYNELNCVQLALQMDTLINRLIDIDQFIFVGYLLLDVVFKNIIIQVDHIEKKAPQLDSHGFIIINHNFRKNTFFLSNFMFNRIKSSVLIFIRLLEALKRDQLESSSNSSLMISLLKCTLSRIIYIFTSSLLRKLTNFNSLIKLEFLENLKQIMFQLYRLDQLDLITNCVRAIRIFHSISLVSIEMLECHYKDQDSKNTLNQKNYSDIDVMTKNCNSAWNFYNVKSSFFMAKKVLLDSNPDDFYYECSTDSLKLDSEGFLNADTNIYRDFTINFSPVTTTSKFFNSNADHKKEVNLTTFIVSLRFHLNLIHMLKETLNHFIKKNSNIDGENFFLNRLIIEFLGCFNRSYLLSLRMERILSLKILLRKIFCLNQETSMVSFVNLSNLAFSGINSIFFGYLIEKSHLFQEKIQVNKLNFDDYDISCLEKELRKYFKKVGEKEVYENAYAVQFLNNYFSCFVYHLSSYYFELNQNVHNIKGNDFNLIQFLTSLISDKTVHEYNEELSGATYMLLNEIREYFESNEEIIKKSIEKNSQKNTDDDMGYMMKDYLFVYELWSSKIIVPFVTRLMTKYNDNIDNIAVILKKSSLVENRILWSTSIIQFLVALNSCLLLECDCLKNIEKNAIENSLELLQYVFISLKNCEANNEQ